MDENKTQPNNKDNLKTVRTYLSDMADTVRTNEISVIKVALAEQNKRDREDIYKKAEGSPFKKTLFVIGGIILILSAIFGAYLLYQQKTNSNQSVQGQITKEETLISYDESSSLLINDGDDLISKINISKKDPKTSDKNISIKNIFLKQEVGNLQQNLPVEYIFSKMNFTAPSSLIRSLSGSYMIGTYTKNTTIKPSLFMIFQTKDYSYTYAGMLEWEKTIATDMFTLFEFNTAENKLKLSERQWKDIIINNKDVRVLLNEDEEPILYYLFADKSNLIITDSEDSIKEIISRLMIKNIKPL